MFWKDWIGLLLHRDGWKNILNLLCFISFGLPRTIALYFLQLGRISLLGLDPLDLKSSGYPLVVFVMLLRRPGLCTYDHDPIVRLSMLMIKIRKALQRWNSTNVDKFFVKEKACISKFSIFRLLKQLEVHYLLLITVDCWPC